MSIITGRGDEGATDLLFGKRIAKTSLRVEALGAVDELNAALGLARAAVLGVAASSLTLRFVTCRATPIPQIAPKTLHAFRRRH